MATDFSNKTSMSSPLTVGSKKENDMPLDIRTRLETMDEIAKVEYPYIGMMFYVKETDKYYSVKTLKAEELVPGIAATKINNYRIGEYEEFEADTSTEEDVLISGVHSIGGLMEGQVIPAGTTFTEFLKMLLQKPETFEYIAPEVSVKLEPAELMHEVGTVLSPKVSFEYKQNDGGEIESAIFEPVNEEQQDEVSIVDGKNPDYIVTVNFLEGKQKHDDFGNPVGSPLPAGQIQGKCAYTGFRYYFFGADDKTIPCETSEEIRALEKTIEDKFSIKAPIGSQRVMIAVPAEGKQPVSIEYDEQGGTEYINNFVKSVISVSGANPEKDMIDYNLYTFIFLIPCAAAMTFNVFLG